jgi:hypothetical protein
MIVKLLSLLIACSWITAPSVYASTIIDQEHIPTSVSQRSNVGYSNRVDGGQTFTVGVTGWLTAFDIWIGRDTNVTMPLLYDFRMVKDGWPANDDHGSEILASGSIPAELFGITTDLPAIVPADLLHIELADVAFKVQEGDKLALVFRSDDPYPLGYSLYSSFGDTYPNGGKVTRFVPMTDWSSPNNVSSLDAVFRTYVTIPEPTALSLAAIMTGYGMMWRRHA